MKNTFLKEDEFLKELKDILELNNKMFYKNLYHLERNLFIYVK